MALRFSHLLAAAAIGFATSAVAADKVVNVYNWSDYIDEDVLAAFTKETGIKVVYDTYDNNDVVETKLMTGGSGYDIVVPTDANMAREIKAGALQKLDKSKIPNLKNMWPLIQQRIAVYDPGNDYAVNYMWGTTGLGYNVDKVKQRLPNAPLDSWALLFDPANAAKLKDCGIRVLDAPEDVFQSALAYLGMKPDSKDQADLDKAAALVKSIRPFIQKFDSSNYINSLANGDVCLALGYSGDIMQARDRAAKAKSKTKVTVGYIIPKEGALMWFDSMVIPKDAPHPEAAHAFMDYMMRPEVAAKNSDFVFYANGNLASQQFLSKELSGDTSVYPSQAVLDRLFTSTTYEPTVQKNITRAWTNLKANR